MKPKDVLIIGAGLSGCAIGLALAKRGIRVTMIASIQDQRHYHSSHLSSEDLSIIQNSNFVGTCPRAFEHFTSQAKKSVTELLGEKFERIDVYKTLLDQLKTHPQVEWLAKHSALELITLDKHSQKRTDIYKRASCAGVYAYHQSTMQIEPILAKETILATGGATSLFMHSTRHPSLRGDGLAMALNAGVRAIPSTYIHFHPLCLYEPGHANYPLPLSLLEKGGKILNLQRVQLTPSENLNLQFYSELLKSNADHLWLDLTAIDPQEIKETYPSIDSYCLNRGYNFAKDLIPIVPAAQYMNGGIPVDKTAQTTLQRLRAIGEISCTGLFDRERNDTLSILESLTWASSAAEDLAKQLSKFAYYFPDIIEWSIPQKQTKDILNESNSLLKQILWLYAGIGSNNSKKRFARSLIENLQNRYNDDASNSSIEDKSFQNALTAAQWLVTG